MPGCASDPRQAIAALGEAPQALCQVVNVGDDLGHEAWREGQPTEHRAYPSSALPPRLGCLRTRVASFPTGPQPWWYQPG
jgi:hypothetical protein